jgi:hypothetical protein
VSARDSHEGWLDNTGAYLLGALSDGEREAYEHHLEACAVCRRELDRLRPAADALPRSVTPIAAPASLRASLMETVEREAAERGSREAPAPGRRPALAGARARLRGLVPRPAGLRPAVAWASAAFLLAVGVLTGFGLNAALNGGEPSSRTVAAQVDPLAAPEASASLAVPGGGNGRGAILRVNGMPRLRSNGVYQVWLERGGEVVSQSTFQVGEDGHGAGAVPESLEDADAVLVTRERPGGAAAPTRAPILRVTL